MRSLNEAITHYESVTDDLDKIYDGYMAYGEQGEHVEECLKHANNARQLAKWLKELKAVQDIIKQHDRDSIPEDYWYIDKIRTMVLE